MSGHNTDKLPFDPRFLERDERFEYDLQSIYKKQPRPHGKLISHPDVGKFVDPPNNSWQANSHAISYHELEFNPYIYQNFDLILANNFHNQNFWNPEKSKYHIYEPARHNIAIMRNFLLNHFYPDGKVNSAEDQLTLEYLIQISREIGQMLENGDSLISRFNPITESISLNELNEIGDGGAEIYQKLLNIQNSNHRFGMISDAWNILTDGNTHDWNLPPIEETPFGKINLMSGGGNIEDDDDIIPEDIESANINYQAQQDAVNINNNTAILGEFAHGESPLKNSNDIESLTNTIKTKAIALGRKILDGLKINFNNLSLSELINFNPDEINGFLNKVTQVADIFESNLQFTSLTNPNIIKDKIISKAYDAFGKISVYGKINALKQAELSGDTNYANQLYREIESMPEQWKNAGNKNISDLLEEMQTGLSRIEEVVVHASQDVDFYADNTDENILEKKIAVDSMVASLHPSAGNNQEKEDKKRQSLAYDEQYEQSLRERQAKRKTNKQNVNGNNEQEKAKQAQRTLLSAQKKANHKANLEARRQNNMRRYIAFLKQKNMMDNVSPNNIQSIEYDKDPLAKLFDDNSLSQIKNSVSTKNTVKINDEDNPLAPNSTKSIIAREAARQKNLTNNDLLR